MAPIPDGVSPPGRGPAASPLPWSTDAFDPVYPTRLRDLSTPPPRLWVRGALPPFDAPALSIVGSRAVSRAGCLAVSSIASGLVRRSDGKRWAILSGGALGIDAAAHEGALEGGGRTWAVFGCGIDVSYPDRHEGLFSSIVAAGGGLLSEYGPGVPPRAGQFPARNRLVAALSTAVLVGECRPGSGALITARLARRLGRPLFALPGSPGADALLRSGAAAPVSEASDLIEGLEGRGSGPGARSRQVSPRPAEMEKLMSLLGGGVAGPEVIAFRMGVPLSRALGLLSEAEMAGWVVRTAGGKFEVIRGD